MKKTMKLLQMLVLALACTTAALASSVAPGNAAQDGVEARADQLLHQMSDFLAGLKQFSVQTENSLEVILGSGQKIQYDIPADLLIQRPNKLMATRTGDIASQEFYYDGNTFTIYDKDSNYFARTEAPATIDETIDFALQHMDIYAPGGDLIYSDAYSILTEDVVSGFYVGESVVDGTRCHHLAFRNNGVDWQLWIEMGAKPLPKKFVITSKWTSGSPQFTLVTRNWNLSPDTAGNIFTFTPPADAKKIDFIDLTGTGSSQR